MDRSTLLALLSLLNSKDRNEFGRYLDSEFFNRSYLIRKLYHRLNLGLQKGQLQVDKHGLFEHLFPEKMTSLKGLEGSGLKKAQGKHLDPLLYRLKKHLEDYLVWKQGQKPGFRRDQHLLQAYYELNAESHFQKKSTQVLSDLDAQEQMNSDYHLKKYLVLRMAFYHYSRVNLDVAMDEKQLAMKHLGSYFIVQNMVQSYAAITRNLIYSQQQSLPFLEIVLKQADKWLPPDDFYLKVFSPLIQGMKEGQFDPGYLKRMSVLIPQNMEGMPKEERFGIYKILLDYYCFLEQFTIQDLPEDIFKIIDEGIEKGYLIQNGKLSYLALIVYVRTGSKCGEYEKVANIIARFKDEVAIQGEVGAVTVPAAYLAFSKGNFKEALRILHHSEKAKYLIDKILERLLLLQCFYETGEFDLLDNCLEGSRKFMSRLRKAGPMVLSLFSQFLNTVRELSLLVRNREGGEALVEKLTQKRIALEQDWLLEKAKAL